MAPPKYPQSRLNKTQKLVELPPVPPHLPAVPKKLLQKLYSSREEYQTDNDRRYKAQLNFSLSKLGSNKNREKLSQEHFLRIRNHAKYVVRRHHYVQLIARGHTPPTTIDSKIRDDLFLRANRKQIQVKQASPVQKKPKTYAQSVSGSTLNIGPPKDTSAPPPKQMDQLLIQIATLTKQLEKMQQTIDEQAQTIAKLTQSEQASVTVPMSVINKAELSTTALSPNVIFQRKVNTQYTPYEDAPLPDLTKFFGLSGFNAVSLIAAKSDGNGSYELDTERASDIKIFDPANGFPIHKSEIQREVLDHNLAYVRKEGLQVLS